MLGPVWVVAQDAYPHFHRLMNEALLAQAVVAGITECRIVAGPFEFVPRAGLKRRGVPLGFVTGIAPIRCHRLVETLMQSYLRVATRHGACRCLRGYGPVGRLL